MLVSAITPTPAGEGKTTTSVGLATYPDHADSPAELIAAADAALYRAKGNGRNRLEIADQAPVELSGV